MQLRQPLANRDVIDLFQRRLISLSGLRISQRQVVQELLQVGRVIAQRVRADVALVAQVFQELSKELIERRHDASSLRMIYETSLDLGFLCAISATSASLR